jgi:hypothetical protein
MSSGSMGTVTRTWSWLRPDCSVTPFSRSSAERPTGWLTVELRPLRSTGSSLMRLASSSSGSMTVRGPVRSTVFG